MKNKRLYRSTTDKKVCGVCAGVAAYIGIDPTIVRVIYALICVFSGSFPGVFIYFILAFIIPEDNGMIDTDATTDDDDE